MDHDELILRAVEALALETRTGISGIHERLDKLNGRTRTAESAIAVLESRTADMVCVKHAERFHYLDEKIAELTATTPPSKLRQATTVAASGVSVSAIAYAAIEAVKAIAGVWK